MAHLFTIGHSNHTLEEFIELLKAFRIDHLVDIRSVPRSRHVPWFNEKSLRKNLKAEKIAYTHLKELGGLRHITKDSINTGWHNASFRGYADYMQTPEFFEGLKQLDNILHLSENVAIMCAEAVPWRCHRSLIADAEVIRDREVRHIMNAHTARPHKLTDFAVIDRSKRPIKLYYPGKPQEN